MKKRKLEKMIQIFLKVIIDISPRDGFPLISFVFFFYPKSETKLNGKFTPIFLL